VGYGELGRPRPNVSTIFAWYSPICSGGMK
jgi:hypothetical protein